MEKLRGQKGKKRTCRKTGKGRIPTGALCAPPERGPCPACKAQVGSLIVPYREKANEKINNRQSCYIT